MKRHLKCVLVGVAMLGANAASSQSYIYPAQGQSPEQQQKDESECYAWAVTQTGFDPANPPAAASVAAPPPPPQPSGGRLRGATAGAVVGGITDHDVGEAALAGAVVGGMKQRSDRRQAARAQEQQTQATQQQAAQAQAAGQENFQKARSACLEGRGYTVK